MNIWFECKARYETINDNGRQKKVSESYLVDAVSFTDAEKRIYQELETEISGEFAVKAVRQSSICEVIPSNEVGEWFQCKFDLISVCERSGNEKRVKHVSLIKAFDIEQAFERSQHVFDDMPVDWELVKVEKSRILEVYPHEAENIEKPVPLNPHTPQEEPERV